MGIKSPAYTQYPNEIIDAMPHLTGGELKVITAIVRSTLGFHRQQAKLSIGRLAALTGLSAQGVRDSLQKPIAEDWVRREQTPEGSIFSLNLDYTEESSPDGGERGSKKLTPQKVDPQESWGEGSKNLGGEGENPLKKVDPSINKRSRSKETIYKESADAREKEVSGISDEEGGQDLSASQAGKVISPPPQTWSGSGNENPAAVLRSILVQVAHLPDDVIPGMLRKEWHMGRKLPWRDEMCRVPKDFALYVGRQISFAGQEETMHPAVKGERHIEGLEQRVAGIRTLVTYWELWQQQNGAEVDIPDGAVIDRKGINLQIGKLLGELGMNCQLPAEWQKKTGVLLNGQLDDRQAAEYLGWLKERARAKAQEVAA